MRFKIFSVILVSLVFVTCVEFEEVSPIPEIKYQSLSFGTAPDSLLQNPDLLSVIIEFDFIDGDADLGVYDEIHSNNLLPDSIRYGLFVDLYEKLDGQYFKRLLIQPTPDSPWLDTLTLNQLLPYDSKMDRVGQNKTIRGIIRSSILFTKAAPYDTMMLEFYIRDRALNKSNIEQTDDFSIKDFSTDYTGI